MKAQIKKQSIFANSEPTEMGGEMNAYLTTRVQSRTVTSRGVVRQSKGEAKIGEKAVMMIIDTKNETKHARTIMVQMQRNCWDGFFNYLATRKINGFFLMWKING